MMEWLGEFWNALTFGRVLFGVGVFAASILLNVAIIAIVFVKIPANYFSSHYKDDFLPGIPCHTRYGALVLKNLAGIVMIFIGIFMLIGPGQGILSILTGLILLDIPGKRPLEARIIKRPALQNAANKLRARYNKPPLELD